ncbi:hypothetical protein QUF74_17530 [Candidatus Halobeggiatoa sp. HSG11]|nr:hypothetical protein [Candidatus Halobeggiatoa sp. HSG11]
MPLIMILKAMQTVLLFLIASMALISIPGISYIGTSCDTSEFACDSFRHWWYNFGRENYPSATSIVGIM